MSEIFRAYDVRGIYPEEINKSVAFKIGAATARFLQAKTLVIGEDARIASPELRGAVIDAATKAGAKVYYIGQCTTPLFYFSVNKLKADGGIMVTASHNPKEYGGLKIVGKGAVSVSATAGLMDIKRISQSDIIFDRSPGDVEEVSILDEYIKFLIKESGGMPSGVKKLKIVIDASNGMVPIVLSPLLKKMGLDFIPLFFDIDGTFPNHSPDISKQENLIALENKVLTTKADIGFTFDGDADRLSVVDENGRKLGADFVTGLLFEAEKGLFKRPKVVYDLRFSKAVRELVGRYGFISPTGHSFIKENMKKHDADIGGELAGHFDFKEANYAESAVLAMLRIIALVGKRAKPISEIIKPLMKYYNSGEINIEIEEREKVIRAIESLKHKYSYGKVEELDGVTVDLWNHHPPAGGWWFNARPSNTEPLLRLVVEAETKELMEQKVAELTQEIKKTA